jgi:hypothetical protein
MNWWEHIATEADLERMIMEMQSLLSGDSIFTAVANMAPALKRIPRGRFAQLVANYHQQHKNPGTKDWQGVYEGFSELLPDTTADPLLRFDVANYTFLSLRNAGGTKEQLLPLFDQAAHAAQLLPEPLATQRLGFIWYNRARYMHQQGNLGEALELYKDAGQKRVDYYFAVRGDSDPAKVKAAATQAWKIRADWPTMFPDASLDQCPVTEQLFAELAPQADPNFSATKRPAG